MRREGWALFVLGLFVAGLTMILVSSIKEPRYNGEPFSHWFAMSSSADEEQRATAYSAFGALHSENPRALSTLLMRLDNEQSPFAASAGIAALARIGAANEQVVPAILKTANRFKGKEVQKTALLALGVMKDETKLSVPFILSCFEIDELRPNALDALGRLGTSAKSAAPALREWALKKPVDERSLRSTLGALSDVTGDTFRTEELPAIAEALMKGNDEPRRKLLLAYVKDQSRRISEPTAERICKHLNPMLSDKEKRDSALSMLSELGSLATPASSALKSLYFAQLDSEAASERPTMISALKVYLVADSYYGVRDLLPEITKRLAKERPATVRENAVWSLYQIGYQARSALPTLQAMTKEADLPVSLKKAAEAAIVRINR